uniref:Uncharacterized protein n=1 Tax=Sphaerodactylus townsendi TaxID=933632 RepID=A0ACB8FPN6_9SAUR
MQDCLVPSRPHSPKPRLVAVLRLAKAALQSRQSRRDEKVPSCDQGMKAGDIEGRGSHGHHASHTSCFAASVQVESFQSVLKYVPDKKT